MFFQCSYNVAAVMCLVFMCSTQYVFTKEKKMTAANCWLPSTTLKLMTNFLNGYVIFHTSWHI